MDKSSSEKRSQDKIYSEEAIQTCIQNIKTGKMSAYGASRAYGVPMSTIRYRMSDRWKQSTKRGPATVLSTAEEQEIVRWMIGMKERGFPVSRETVLSKVTDILSSKPDREKWFKNNRPGRKWIELFIRRNPDCQSLMKASEPVAVAGEGHIRGWFQTIESWLTRNNMRDILEDPERIFIYDELSFSLPPETKKICPRPANSKVPAVERTLENVAIILSFCASGVAVPPHIVLSEKRKHAEMTKYIPPGWGLDVMGPHGWPNPNSFRHYIVHVFHPFLVARGVKLPIVYFVNGYALNKAFAVHDLCHSLGIVLVSLYNASTSLVPANIGVVELLRSEWQNVADEWYAEHPRAELALPDLFPVLDRTFRQGVHASVIRNGFHACGLQPFNVVNAVDYSSKFVVDKPHAHPPSMPLPDLPNEAESSHTEEWEHMEIPEPEVSLPPEHVTIPIDKIYEGYDLIGGSTINRIEGDISSLTREERIIRFFYREFIRPNVHFNGHPMSNDGSASQSGANDEERLPASRVIDDNAGHFGPVKVEQRDSCDGDDSDTLPPADGDGSQANMTDVKEEPHFDFNSDFGHFFT